MKDKHGWKQSLTSPHTYPGRIPINAQKNVNQGFSLISFMKRMKMRQIQLLKSSDPPQMLDLVVV